MRLAWLLLVTTAISSRGQWVTETMDLKSGWNAVLLHVDAGHTTLDSLIGGDSGNPIVEVWQWHPPATTQFTESPQNPNPGSEWSSWVRDRPGSSLQRLMGDTAYLVRVGSNAPTFRWAVKGRPVPPRQHWTVTGLNLLGFPTVPNTPPAFDAFLARSPELSAAAPEIFRYVGGEISASNPAKLVPFLFRSVPVKRGQAFWIRAGDVFNHYFGPFEVVLSGQGLVFGDGISAAPVRLRNLTTNALTVNLSLLDSEAAPAGQAVIAGALPLILRGDFNITNLVYGYTNLPTGAVRSWTLAPAKTPGSEIEVVIGLNRSAITSNPGALLAGVLRFTDSLGFSQIDIGASATAASGAGLWVGTAVVGAVGQTLKSYTRDADNRPIVATDGSYLVSSSDTSIGGVARPYPLRLIVHNPSVGNAVLLQRVFVGLDRATNTILSLKEAALSPQFIKDARRLSAVHLPWSAQNPGWPFSGRFGAQTNLTTAVTLGYNDRASSPFLHSYHPDHDNLNATFKTLLPQGSESYGVQRQITLNVTPPANDFGSLVSANRTFNGEYREVITLQGLARAGGATDTRRFEVRGTFSLNRVSDIAQMTPAP